MSDSRLSMQLKGFKILSNVIPGRVKNLDDVVNICAGLCNLQPQLIQKETEKEETSEIDEDIDEQGGDK